MRFKISLDAASARVWLADLLPTTVKIVVASAVLEFLLLRVLNRMSDRYPDWMRGALSDGVFFGGIVAFNLAFIASILVVLAIASLMWERGRGLSLLLLMWIPMLLGAQILGSGATGMIVLSGVLVSLILFTAITRRVRLSWGERGPSAQSSEARGKWLHLAMPVFLAFLLATYLTAFYLHTGDAMANLGIDPPSRAVVYAAGEATALGAALLAPLAFWRRPEMKVVLLPTAAALAFAAFALSRPDILPLITFWSMGFQLHLSLPLYVVAIWCYVFAAANLTKGVGWGSYILPGLLLIALGGRMLNDFYLIQMALVGVLALTLDDDLKSYDLARRELTGGGPQEGSDEEA